MNILKLVLKQILVVFLGAAISATMWFIAFRLGVL
jgi:hypothetical protein